MIAVSLALLFTPFFVLLGAGIRAAVLFWPTMLLLGAAHSYLPWVPALGWWPTLIVLALLTLLLGQGTAGDND